jgi:arabinose-5-phosphate isomerase
MNSSASNAKLPDAGALIALASSVIAQERDALNGLIPQLTPHFAEVVYCIYHTKGKVIVSGVGKSAIVAQKIVATLNSTGTNAVFLHAADAIHGDLGIVRDEDVVLLISKSGETPEIKVLIPLLKARPNILVAMVGTPNSYLALQARFCLLTTVDQEACPNNLAPTSSTTAQMVMGDALAIALLNCRGFSPEDFARIHPGGALGKKLYLRVEDVYLRNEVPAVNIDDDLRKVIVEISTKRLGATAVIQHGKLVGIITDGDLRRMLMNNPTFDHLRAADIMTRNPKSISPSEHLAKALDIMRHYNITQLPVVENTIYKGVIHLHDILKEGVV